MAALQYIHEPSYAALLLRRTYADLSLPGALMDRAHEWFQGTGAKWQDKEKTWVFPSGATITFGYLENEKDKFRYQGAEFSAVFFDELTQFPETAYRYLHSRTRRKAGAKYPIRIRGASNPGGIGHEWVRQRFIVEGPTEGRPFIPARLEDNPHLDREEYERSLSQLDPVTRAQLRNGDWDVLPEGRLFKREWFHIVDALPSSLRLVRYWDMAATEPKPGTDPDWTAGAKVGMSAEGGIYICDIRRTRATPQHTERLLLATAQEDTRSVPIWMEEEGGSAGKGVTDYYTRKVLQGFQFRGERVTGSKLERAGPLSSQAEAGNVHLLRGAWNTDFLDELCLAEGTLIATRRGSIPIEDVRVGDFAWTRNGWNRIYKAELTSDSAEVIMVQAENRTLTGTRNHPVWVCGKGFIPLGSLREGDELLCLEPGSAIQFEKPSFTLGLPFTATPSLSTTPRSGILAVGGTERRLTSTGLSTNQRSARFQKVTTFITRTGIPSTIVERISNSRAVPSIPSSISSQESPSNIGVKGAGRLSNLGEPVARFTALCAAAMRSALRSEKRGRLLAKNAALRSIRSNQGRGTVLSAAPSRRTGMRTLRRSGSVSSVGRVSPATRKGPVVRAVAVTHLGTVTGKRRVYNLSVECLPEYFANGVLVHNCAFPADGVHDDQVDAVSGAANKLFPPKREIWAV